MRRDWFDLAAAVSATEAVPLANQALALRIPILGEDHIETARTRIAAALGPTHLQVGRAMLLSAFAFRQGKPEAIERMRQAVAVVQAACSPAQYDRLEAEAGLAAVLLHSGVDAPGALWLFRQVGRAALDRVATYRDFGQAAQAEIRHFSSIYAMQVHAAWQTAQLKR